MLDPNGYKVYGSKPSFMDLEEENDGTVAPCAAIGSIVFTPEESIKAMEYYYNYHPKLWSRYGFRDGYNVFKKNKKWYSKECIGIDKGISLIMIENYLSGMIWEYAMKNEFIQKGLEMLHIKKREKQLVS